MQTVLCSVYVGKTGQWLRTWIVFDVKKVSVRYMLYL